MATDTEGLEKVHIDLPNHWATGGESMWATPMGNNLYRLENVPFFAYGLNFLDIVHATPEEEGLAPEIRKVVTPSRHRTYRVMFQPEIAREDQNEMLDSLGEWGGSYERATATNVAIDINPSGDHLAIFDQLEKFEDQDVLVFETCEARVEGSFDDSPEER